MTDNANDASLAALAPVTITVDLDDVIKNGFEWRDYDIDGEPIGGRTGFVGMVASLVANKLAGDMQSAVRDIVAASAKEKVDDIIDDVVYGKIGLTNGFGEPTGKTTTLRELLVDNVKTELARKVTRNGSVAAPYDRDAQTYINYVARTAAAQAIHGELDAAIKEAVTEVKSGVTALVSEEVSKRIVREVVR